MNTVAALYQYRSIGQPRERKGKRMSIWMELHCDMPSERRAQAEYGQHGRAHGPCYSDENANPGVMVEGNGTADTAIGIRVLKAEAKDAGWKLRRGIGWICPICNKYPEPTHD